jgi:diaminopimelate decarboxylase
MEFLAARREGFPPDRILVNGPAKHHWLSCHPARGLFVNFDSATEAAALLPLAKKLGWRVGVRCLTDEEYDPEDPRFPTQFGLAPVEAVALLRKLRRSGVRLETIHLHLRTNVPSADVYERALDQLAEICRTAHFQPKHVDMAASAAEHPLRTAGGRREVLTSNEGLPACAENFPAPGTQLENG